MGPMWWGPLSREECGGLGRVALAAASLKHPRQPSSVPVRKHGQGSGKEQGWRWESPDGGLQVCLAVALACQPLCPLSPPLSS